MIKKLSDYPIIDGYDLGTSILLQENGIDPGNFEKNFPDLGLEYPSYKTIIPMFSQLKNTDKFIDFIERNSTKKIVNISDYDCDGIMSAVIFNIILRRVGISTDFVVPNRLEDGYGMSNALIDKAIEKGAEAIITSDNGISCREQVEYAKEKGLDVFITDHHIGIEQDVPQGVEIVDPCYNNDIFPSICGAFVVAKLGYALLQKKQIEDQYLVEEIMAFAAIATITDLMPVLGENRLLLCAAFEYIDFLKEKNIWNRVMKVISGLGGRYYLHDEDQMASENLFGFYIGPTINAISRIKGDPTGLIQNIIDCDAHGVYIEKQYSAINRERKGYSKALYALHEKNDDPVDIEILNESDYEFPISGLLGLLANNIASIENKPALVGMLKEGKYEFSCRSIPGYSIHDAYERLKEILPDIGLAGGGHAAAMGMRFTASSDNLLRFKEALTEDFYNNKDKIKEKTFFEADPNLIDDVIISMDKFKIFGNGFRKPRFIYSGTLESYDSETRIAKIGEYSFIAYLRNPGIGKEMQVIFDVEFNSFNGPYFRIDSYERI